MEPRPHLSASSRSGAAGLSPLRRVGLPRRRGAMGSDTATIEAVLKSRRDALLEA
jgi:hypothetical protein